VSSLLRSNISVATGTAISRVTGLARVAVLGIVLGQGGLTDAYNQANSTPNLVYELLLGGVLSATLVPLFTRLDHDDDRDGTAAVVSVSVVVLAVVTAVAVVAAPLIFHMYSWLTAGSVDAGEYRQVGTLLARIFLVQIFFYGLNALASAVLNARRRFFAAAWVPALSNVVIIGSLLLVPGTVHNRVPVLGDVLTNGRLRWTLGLGATIGIAVMAIALVPALVAAKAPLRFHPDFRNPAVARLRSLSGWALGYVIANQAAILVVQNLTRAGTGNQDAYTRAFTFFVLPHGLLAMSIATTFLPEMASAIKERDKQRLIDRTSLGIRLIALLTVPAGFGLFTLRRPIIGLAFEHGKFTAAAADNTSRALAGFALGLGGFSVYLFALRAFYAHQDARTPFVVNAVENLLNIAFAFALAGRYGIMGLGASFALAYVISAVWTLKVLSYKVPGFPMRQVLGSLWRIVLASVVMAEAVWAAARLVGGNSGSEALVRVGGATIIGVVVYVGVLALLQAPEITELQARFRRSS
jgi:putative peptidoglycan lipid II flippase